MNLKKASSLARRAIRAVVFFAFPELDELPSNDDASVELLKDEVLAGYQPGQLPLRMRVSVLEEVVKERSTGLANLATRLDGVGDYLRNIDIRNKEMRDAIELMLVGVKAPDGGIALATAREAIALNLEIIPKLVTTEGDEPEPCSEHDQPDPPPVPLAS